MNTLPYGKQQITEEDIQEVVRVLRSDYLTGGPEIERFEKAFAAYLGAPHAIAVANGSAALHLCAMALDVTPGQRWITSPNTFAATAHCIRLCGGDVELVDIDPGTGQMDLDLLEKKLSASPAGTYHGILPVAYAGFPHDLPRIRRIADQYDLKIIEDACHAPGAAGQGFRCGDGTYADLSIFSFHPVKHLTTAEGGMITTANPELAARIRNLRTHGIERRPLELSASPGAWYYEIRELGMNYRLSAVQAVLGTSQLSRAIENLNRRREITAFYREALADTQCELPAYHEGHAWHLYVIRHPKRKELFDHLRAANLWVQVHYVPLHHHPYYSPAAESSGPLPHSDRFYQSCLSLPMYPDLTGADLARMVEEIKRFERGM